MQVNEPPRGGSLPVPQKPDHKPPSKADLVQEISARTIQGAWRKHKGQPKIHSVRRDSIKPSDKQSVWFKRRDMLYGPIMKGPHGPKTEIPIATIEKVVDKLVQAGDRESLRRLANILFTGPIPYRTMMSLQHAHPSVQALVYLLRDPGSDLEIVKKTMIEGVKEWRLGGDQYSYVRTEEYNKKMQVLSHDIPANVDTFAERTDTDPEQWIEITHGGGEWNILEFLKGETEGYPLERGGVGLQVSPKEAETEKRSYGDYSIKAYAYFDRAAILSAKIQAKYLKAAPNGYEAGLPSKSVGHLKDIEVKVVSTGTLHKKTEKGWIEFTEQQFDDPEMGKKIFESQEKS